MNVAQLTRSIALLASLTLITACGGGGGGSKGNPAAQGSNFDSGCIGFCATNSPANLTATDVQNVISRAVQEATSQGVSATIAVTDRVGNVLGLFQMTAAIGSTFTISSGLVDGDFGLENVNVLPSTYAAISKAVTGSYLASEGNAFSTRTASQIIQEHFNPGVAGQFSGPLFGVQFSQLPCSDLVNRNSGVGVGRGPQRSPLGLSADPGGFPLYKNGHPVGGIGVISDGVYGLDRDPLADDLSIDELIAIAGQFGFAPSVDRQANRISVDLTTLEYSDVDSGDLASNPQSVPSFATTLTLGSLVDSDAVPNYFNETGAGAADILAGSTFGMLDSGIVDADTIDTTFAGLDAFVLANGAGANQYPPITTGVPGGAAVALSVADVTQLLRSALGVANQARGQIRRPLNSQARVTISVVDTAGTILGIVRTRDAPLFGTDVSLQKARTATFFSSFGSDAVLTGATAVPDGANPLAYASTIGDYSTNVKAFIDATALNNGIAFADRSGGNLSRPLFPDGTDGSPNGPFSKLFTPANTATNQWSPFSNGLQLDLVFNELVDHLANGTNITDCTQIGSTRLANGIQIFPGSVPIYRGGVLIGGIGVSGDGVDQDDMISFLGTFRASIARGNTDTTGVSDAGNTVMGNAVIGNRANTITAGQLATNPIRYVQCPINPFVGSSDQNVCDGK